jgi:hypothetical protein
MFTETGSFRQPLKNVLDASIHMLNSCITLSGISMLSRRDCWCFPFAARSPSSLLCVYIGRRFLHTSASCSVAVLSFASSLDIHSALPVDHFTQDSHHSMVPITFHRFTCVKASSNSLRLETLFIAYMHACWFFILVLDTVPRALSKQHAMRAVFAKHLRLFARSSRHCASEGGTESLTLQLSNVLPQLAAP